MGLAVGVLSPLHMSISRTESVAEKMLTNWFTFLLYKFLKVGRLERREHQGGCRGRWTATRETGNQKWMVP